MNKFPFTATQWQELEHQALIFKYMVSGIPIPPDLLITIKRSYLEPNCSSKLLISHHPQHVGWNCFQMGLGRKIDPEPGRCRRTDGKKWRCSKEAFPDSKYCERHMHRGKNRSRKPVEVLKITSGGGGGGGTNTTSTTSSILTNSPTMLAKNSNSLSSISLSSDHSQNRHNLHYYPCYNNVADQNPSFAYHQYHNSSSRPNGVLGLSTQESNNSNLLFESDVRNRYVYGLKEEVDEHAFFSEEPSRPLREYSGSSSMDDSWQLTPLTISCSSSKQTHEHSFYSHNNKLHDKQGHHDTREDKTQKTIHFFDEWPMKEKESWLELDDKSSNITTGSVSSTQLSISMPKSSYDFPIFSSRTRNGD